MKEQIEYLIKKYTKRLEIYTLDKNANFFHQTIDKYTEFLKDLDELKDIAEKQAFEHELATKPIYTGDADLDGLEDDEVIRNISNIERTHQAFKDNNADIDEDNIPYIY